MCERELETEQNCHILTSPLMAISVVFFVLQGCSTGGLGAQLSAGCWLSLPHLVTNGSGLQTNWLLVFTELYNSSIVHSISPHNWPSECVTSVVPGMHVWSSSSGNNCHAVHRSLSSGASVCDCNTGFYLVPYCQPNPPTRFLPITGHRNVSFAPSLEWHVWPGRRWIYNNTGPFFQRSIAGLNFVTSFS